VKKEEEPVTKDNIIEKLKEADKNDKRPKIRLADKIIPSSHLYTVIDNIFRLTYLSIDYIV
jgi:hypothetical protein